MDFFQFTKTDYDYIVNECMLDKEYQKLLEYKIKYVIIIYRGVPLEDVWLVK